MTARARASASYAQHAQPLQPAEHPAADRVDLIGRQVELDDGRRPLESPVFHLCDLVVAEVAAGMKGEEEEEDWRQTGSSVTVRRLEGGAQEASLTFSSAGRGS